MEGGNADLLIALATRGISTFAATGSNTLRGGFPPVPIAHATQLEVSHQGYTTAVLAPFCLGAPWGQHPPSRALLVGHGSLTSSLCSGRPTCFSAGKQGAALLVLTSRQRKPGPGGKETCCPSHTSEARSSGHHDRDTLRGLLAIVHSFPAGSLRIHHTGHLEELICSIQSYKPILPKQQGFAVTTGCFGQLPGQGPPSTAALRLSQALGLIFSHFVNRLQEHSVTQA